MTPDSLLDGLLEGAYRVDLERRIVSWNPAAEKLTGFARDEVIGRPCAQNVLRHVDAAGRCLCVEGCPLAATIGDGRPREAQVLLHHRDGHRVPVTVRAFAERDETGAIVGALELFAESGRSEELRQRVADLERLAFLDPLTEIANRRFAELTLRHRTEEHSRYGWGFGVALFDLDDFKLVNDRFGHAAGDRVLRMVATTLTLAARTSDVVARWGGDELLAILRASGDESLEAAVQRLRDLVESAFLVHDGEVLRVSASIGVAAMQPGDTPESLVARADAQLYGDKARRGRLPVAVSGSERPADAGGWTDAESS